ncbi:acetate--CoA ligase family protein [Rhodococcus rhodnii]|uniref:acetate--CoA ligase family protein n=1 Tax=Rhodococcus rhodnii TaxID=38312 RepID=UPI0011606FF6|nr:acetate--CoA ligase family protein [Rhodococcus rhodnii]
MFAHETTTGVRASLLSEVSARTGTAVAAVWMNEWLEGPGSRALDSDPCVTLFRSAARCMQTISLWQNWHHRRRILDGLALPERISDSGAEAVARAVLAATDAESPPPTEQQAKALLSAYGITVPRESVATTPSQAVSLAERFGYPVVLKVSSPDIQHKTEVGGVRLNLATAEEVRLAAAEILDNARILEPTARIDGVSVQTMIGAGVEVLLGARIDPQFGPMITVGAGGIFVELLRDVSTQLAPVTPEIARRAIESLRLHKILTGLRGDTGYDIEALVDTVVRFSEMVSDLADELSEVDVNPLIVGRAGAIAADALIVPSHSAALTV